MKISSLVFTILLLIGTLTAASAETIAPPEVNAASAILIETGTNTVLFEKNADTVIPPASMTKLMTIHIALNFIKAGTAAEDSLVPISEKADFHSLPPRSSLMFIEEGQNVSLLELLKGLALPSGNDAGIAVAEFLAGSVEEYVALMNLEAENLGLTNTHFDDSSGLSEKNKTTAREFAAFCAFYIGEHPEALTKLHLLQWFTYPEEHNIQEGGTSAHGPITQPNHNLLIGHMAGVDGLKTGYIDESGYNLSATAESAGRRLILVTMGGPGENSRDGSMNRLVDGAVLLNYGFYGWSTLTPEVPSDRKLRLYGGKKNELTLNFSPAGNMTIPSRTEGYLEFKENYKDISFPIEEGAAVGNWTLIDDEGIIYQRGLITAAESVEEGNFLKRLVDKFRRGE